MVERCRMNLREAAPGGWRSRRTAQRGGPGLDRIYHAAVFDLLRSPLIGGSPSCMPANKAGMQIVVTRIEVSGAQRAFELFFRPLDDVVELLVALCKLCHHHGVDGLVVHLGADFGTRRRAEHRGLLVAARRIAVHHPFGGSTVFQVSRSYMLLNDGRS